MSNPTPDQVRLRAAKRRAVTLIATTVAIVIAGFAIALLPGMKAEEAPTEQNLAANPKAPNPALAVPAEADQLFKQAVIMLHAKQYEHAVTALHRVLQLAPTMTAAHVNMGYAMLGLHRPGVARDFFRSAIALRPDQANAHYGLAEALAELGDRNGAIREMNEYLRLAPANDRFVAKAQSLIGTWRKG